MCILEDTEGTGDSLRIHLTHCGCERSVPWVWLGVPFWRSGNGDGEAETSQRQWVEIHRRAESGDSKDRRHSTSSLGINSTQHLPENTTCTERNGLPRFYFANRPSYSQTETIQKPLQNTGDREHRGKREGEFLVSRPRGQLSLP